MPTQQDLIAAAAWLPDQGDGTYINPVLHADYSDPDVVRHGDDFYLVASSMNCVPGLPILHSRDLVNWTIINHAIKQVPHPRFSEVQHGEGVWAPAIRFHAGLFWIFFPTPDEGIYVTTATDPRGAWSTPYLLMEGKGLIDPCPLWDDDGKAYLIMAYAGSRSGIRNKLCIFPMSADGRKILGDCVVVAAIDPTLPALEGPKLYKQNGWYYIWAPSGGVQMGWQVVFRSRHIHGPYEERIVLAQRGTEINGPHQGALVDTAAGEWWFLHFQDRDLYGRVVHLQPVQWENDWPLVGIDPDANRTGKPVLRHPKPKTTQPVQITAPQTTDTFKSGQLGLQWQWHANSQPSWYSLTARPGQLRLFPQFLNKLNFVKAGNLLLQKFPAPEFVVTTEISLPEGHPHLHAGLIVVGSHYVACDLQKHGGRWSLRLLTGGENRGEMTLQDDGPLRLRLVVLTGGECRFGVVDQGGQFQQIGPAFFARAGTWIGAKFGLYSVSNNMVDLTGHADFAHCTVTNTFHPQAT
jgi:beta-xylosidase